MKDALSLEERVERLEAGDRLQAKQIRLIQRLQSALTGALAIGLLLGWGAIQDEDNRKTLETLAVGVITASVSGLSLSGFVGAGQTEDGNRG